MRSELPVWVALVACIVVVFAHSAFMQPWTLDDAYISMRYARNLAEGHGLVYNPGERVEGYTNFLWTVLMAAGAALGKDLVVWTKALGGVFAVATLGLVATMHRWLAHIDARTSLFAVLLLGTCGVYSRWVWSGMEVPLVAFLGIAAFALHLRSLEEEDVRFVAASGVVAGLAAIARPDAGLVFGAMFLDRLDRGPKRLITLVACWASIWLPWYAWRFAYYGHPLPNTFYVKVGSSFDQLERGLLYVSDFVGVALPLVVIPLAGLLFGQRLFDRWSRGLVVFAVLYVAYVAVVGGDVFWGWRFFAHVLPVFALVAAIALVEVPGRRAVAVLAASVSFNVGHLLFNSQVSLPGNISQTGEKVGRWLADCAPGDALIAVNIAGSIPFYSNLPTIDMLGLADAHIAHREMPEMGGGKPGHEKGDGAYVLSRQPDIVQLGSSRGRKLPKFVGDAELFALDAFHDQYMLGGYEVPGAGNVWLWVRRASVGGKGLCVSPARRPDLEPDEADDEVFELPANVKRRLEMYE